jgi:hypothetical protein
VTALQIGRVTAQSSPTSVPPYALSTPYFRFRALASLAARAPLGGPREVVLATYLVARLVDDCLPEKALPAVARAERSASARGWLANVALPTAVRASLIRLTEATGGDLTNIEPAMASVITIVDSYLDAPSRLELARLEHAVAQ